MNPTEHREGFRVQLTPAPCLYSPTPRFLSGAPLMFQYPSVSTSPYQSSMTQSYLANPVNIQSTSANLRGIFNYQSAFFGSLGSIQQTSARLFPGIMPQSQFNACVANHAPVLGSPASSSVLGGPISTFTSPSVTVSQLPLPLIGGPLSEIDQNVMVKQPLQKLADPVSPKKGTMECFEDLKFESNVTLSSPAAGWPSTRKPKGQLVGVRVSELEDNLRRKSTWRQSQQLHKLTG